jgi:hypothetical protein
MIALVELCVQLGLPSALVIFFVFYGQQRENRMSDRITKLETQDRADLLDIIRKSTESSDSNTHIMVELVEAVRESNSQVSTLLTRMAERPCLFDDSK